MINKNCAARYLTALQSVYVNIRSNSKAEYSVDLVNLFNKYIPTNKLDAQALKNLKNDLLEIEGVDRGFIEQLINNLNLDIAINDLSKYSNEAQF